MLALAYVLLIQSVLFTLTGQAMISGITAVETKHPDGKIPLLMYSRQSVSRSPITQLDAM